MTLLCYLISAEPFTKNFFSFSNILQANLSLQFTELALILWPGASPKASFIPMPLAPSSLRSSQFLFFAVSWLCLIQWKTISHKTHEDLRLFALKIFVPCVVTSVFHIWPDLVLIIFDCKILLYLEADSPYTWWTLKAMHCDKTFKLKTPHPIGGYLSNINNREKKAPQLFKHKASICSQFRLLNKPKGTIKRF